jgi:hypothetical protein
MRKILCNLPLPDPATPAYVDETIVTVDDDVSGVVAVPTGTTEGDRLVLWIAKTEAATFTGLTGWTQTIAEESVPGAMLYCYEKEASAADAVPGSYTPAWSGEDDAVIYMTAVDQCGASTFKGAGADIGIAGTELLLHCDGVSEATSFPDDSGNSRTVTANGAAAVTTSSKVFGTGGLALNGIDSYLSIPHDVAFNPGAGDFLFFDGRVLFSSVPESGIDVLAGKHSYSSSNAGWEAIYSFNSSKLGVTISTTSASVGTSRVSTSTWVPLPDVFYHVRIMRRSGYIYFYVNGTAIGSPVANTEDIYANAAEVLIGAGRDVSGNITRLFDGVFDEIRIGAPPILTDDFTVPASAYTVATDAPSCPAVTTGSANNIIMRAMVCAGAPTVTEPAGTTEVGNTASPNNELTFALAYEASATPEDVGTAAFALSAAQPWAAATVAFRPGDENPEPSIVWGDPTTTWSANPLSEAGSFAGYSIRQIMAAATITTSGEQCRVTFRATSTANLVIANASIVEQSSGADGTTTPTEFLFSGVSGVTITAGTEVASDWLDYAIDETKTYLVIHDITTGNLKYENSGSDGVYYKAATASYSQATVTGFTFDDGGVYDTSKLEVRSQV